MKLSHGLNLALQPLFNFVPVPVPLFQAIRKVGKRGNKTYYPNDLRRIKVVLEVWHDVTNKLFSVEVVNNNFASAIEHLAQYVKEEDYLIENYYQTI